VLKYQLFFIAIEMKYIIFSKRVVGKNSEHSARIFSSILLRRLSGTAWAHGQDRKLVKECRGATIDTGI
jgi:hypothetical protein